MRKVARTSAVCGESSEGSCSGPSASERCQALQLFDGGGVYACVLAEVERVEVEAEGADGEDERVDVLRGEALAVVLRERVAEELEVVGELLGVGVGGK